MLRGVPQHVLDAAAQRTRKAAYRATGLAPELNAAVSIGPAELVADIVDHGLQQFFEVNAGTCFMRLRIQPGVLENLADQPVQPLGLGIDAVEFRQVTGLAARKFQRNTQAGQWRAQLVRHVARELGLLLPGALQVTGHAIEVLGQQADLVTPPADAIGDACIEIACGNRDGGFTEAPDRL